jgi:hypothetical protein
MVPDARGCFTQTYVLAGPGLQDHDFGLVLA